MDHEKAEAISPVIHEYSQSSSQRHSSINDGETQVGFEGFDPSLDEPSRPEERLDRQGESLWSEAGIIDLEIVLMSNQARLE